MLTRLWQNKKVEIDWFSARGTKLSSLLQGNQFIISTLELKTAIQKGAQNHEQPCLYPWSLAAHICAVLKAEEQLHKSQLIHKGFQGNSTFPFSLIIYTSDSILTLSFWRSHPFFNGLAKQRCLFRSGKECFAGFSLSPQFQMCGLGHLKNHQQGLGKRRFNINLWRHNTVWWQGWLYYLLYR